jgi:hypothetical protein
MVKDLLRGLGERSAPDAGLSIKQLESNTLARYTRVSAKMFPTKYEVPQAQKAVGAAGVRGSDGFAS